MKKVSTRLLRVPLTSEEFEDRAAQLAQALEDVESTQNALASVKSTFKADLDAATSRVKKFQQQVQERAEWRKCDVEEEFDYEAKTVTTTNIETGEVIDTRQMRAEELQAEIELQ